MRASHLAVLAAVLLLTATSAIAQTAGPQGADSNQHSQTAPSGSAANSGAPGLPKTQPPSDSTDKQPPVATGEDLKGPPKAFPSNKAPE